VKRALKILGITLVALPILFVAGFRIWLQLQPDDFRAQIEQYSTLEFIGMIVDYVSPAPAVDRAGFDRREYPERGHSPWVIRSSLDGRPRMLSIALAPELWLAYSTETASIHQLWRGDIEYTGPVYDARHGAEPTSRGVAYLRPSNETAWRIRIKEEWQTATIRWRGHGFDPDTGDLWLRFDVMDFAGRSRTVTEWPDREGGVDAPRVGLDRRFTFGRGPAIALVAEPDGDPAFEVLTGAARVGERIEVEGSVANARILWRLDAPTLQIDRSVPEARGNEPFAEHDCHTCHNVRERVVGPAWSEVALRYAGANREVTLGQLADRIREGSVGRWGEVAMTPHPEIDRVEARRLAGVILETPPSDAPVPVVDTGGSEGTWTFRSDTEPAPTGSHPSLTTKPIAPAPFTPMVGGLAWLPDGRLGVSTWDRDGAVFAVSGWDGPADQVTVKRIAEGLHEPLGLAVDGDAVYVMQKQEITQLVDHNKDGWTDEYRTVANDWRVTSNFHEFGFGLVAKDGSLFASLGVCVLNGGKSCQEQTPDRGKILRANPRTGEVKIIAGGFRTPNGLALAPNGDLFVADNQGDWLPSSKLIRIEEGADYGWRAPTDVKNDRKVSPPTLWLPQNEIGNSPTQPLFLTRGPYAGHVLFGDIFNGGLKRGALEEVEGVLQGAAFHFSGGFEGPINRLLATRDGNGFIVGEIGSRGNWGERGKQWFGIEVVTLGEEPAFEPFQVSLLAHGFSIEFTKPLADDLELTGSDFQARDWFYVPSPIYGGPKYDLRDLEIAKVEISQDRRSVELKIDGLKENRVVYLRFDPRLRSQEGDSLWVNEAWYTLNRLSASNTTPVGVANAATGHASGSAAPRVNALSEAERRAGWRLLFDGKSFAGWKIYGVDEEEPIEHWEIDDDALHFTRDVSLPGMILNHLNPFTKGALDLMTRERFDDFELSIDWRISPGGNSGIFYAVPNEETSLSWDLGLEMQVLDDAGHMDGEIETHRAGDLYDLQSLARGTARPVGEWNTARIRVEGDHIRHWLNDVLVADIVRGSPAWQSAIEDSKFAGTEGFGLARRGHLTLQDHGDPVWFRNIKIREIGPN